MRKLITLGFLFSLLALASLATPPTTETSAQANTELQYAAKFVCGRTDAGIAAQGQYFTIVNVHNPSPNRAVEFRKKFARSLPNERAGRITEFFRAALRPDEAMGIDCPNIYQHTGIAPGTFIEGYVVIHTPMELDVVTVYTAGHPEVETLHTERVPFRRVPLPPPCPNLNLNLDTGVASWRLTADPMAGTVEPRVPNVVTPPTAWSSLAGSQWIGPTPNASGDLGKYTYEFCFCLCQGFTNASLTLRGLADNSADVYVNGSTTPVGSFTGFSGAGSLVQTNNQQLFQVGTNCVRVEVNNQGGPTGLNIDGTMTATAGRCPNPTDPVRVDDDPIFTDRVTPTATPRPRRRP